jgi:hypothetical protein
METHRQDIYVADKDKNTLLRSLMGDAEPGSPVYEQQKMGIFVRCTEDLENAIHNSTDTITNVIKVFTDSSNRLSNRLLVFNCIFGFFTVVGTVLTVWLIFWK